MSTFYNPTPTNFYDDYIAHHGILGMKWGKQNGPPYPLGSGDHSKSEKSAGWKKSLGGGRNEEMYDRKKKFKAANKVATVPKKESDNKVKTGHTYNDLSDKEKEDLYNYFNKTKDKGRFDSNREQKLQEIGNDIFTKEILNSKNPSTKKAFNEYAKYVKKNKEDPKLLDDEKYNYEFDLVCSDLVNEVMDASSRYMGEDGKKKFKNKRYMFYRNNLKEADYSMEIANYIYEPMNNYIEKEMQKKK